MSLPWVYLRRYVLAMALSIVALVFTLFAEPATSAQAQIAFEDFNSFTGAGFSPTPTPGQLDSNKWIVTGMSEGSMAFGDTKISGDFARGMSAGGVTTGGIYAFDRGGGNRILGVQPTGTDFVTGTIVFSMTNDTAGILSSLDISYTIWVYNNGDRASSVAFQYSADCTSTYSTEASLTYTTPLQAPTTITWLPTVKATTISGLNLPAGAPFCIRWTSDDAGGSGSRDEFGIDDVTVTPTSPTLIELADFHAQVAGDRVRLLWQTAVEVDNAGFNLYRATSQAGPYTQVNPALIAAQADPGQGASYAYTDQPGPGAYYYLLEDVDTAGKATRHGPVTAEIRAADSQGAGKLFLPVISH